MSNLREVALNSNSWPFQEAKKVLKRYKKAPPEKGYVLFETGYGPSGLPHIGTFGEVLRTTMVMRAFQEISDIPTKLICFSDDLDGMRKIPSNVPEPENLREYLQMPLTSVPDPFNKFKSFGDHNNSMLRAFLDTFGFEYEFYSATKFYRSGQFDKILKRAAEKYDEIMDIMLPTLRKERRETYSIFLPIHPHTGRVLYVPIKNVNPKDAVITFYDEDNTEFTLPVTEGNVKLQWKPDFGARWAALGVDFEMYGKDHSTNTPIYDKICKVLGGLPPEHFTYELFLDENGQKISKTSGNGVSIDDWLKYASAESLSYFMYLKPKTAKRLHFDVIPKAMDDYHQNLKAFVEQDKNTQLSNPVFHIHGRKVPCSDMLISFSMLLNLVAAANAGKKEQLWGFIKKYAPDASLKSNPDLDKAVGFAIRYYNDFIKPKKSYRSPNKIEREALKDLRNKLINYKDSIDPEELQSIVFSCGRERFDQMRDWFKAIYEILLGASQGPRFGGFIALYGVNETILLIDNALDGSLGSI